MEWMLMPLQRYADFTGRSRRKEFWMFYVLIIGVVVVLQILGAILGNIAGLLGGLVWLGLLIPSLAVTVRRMHDVDKSGWFCLIPIYSLILAVTEGTKGPNRFGPDPIDGGASNLSQTFQ